MSSTSTEPKDLGPPFLMLPRQLRHDLVVPGAALGVAVETSTFGPQYGISAGAENSRVDSQLEEDVSGT